MIDILGPKKRRRRTPVERIAIVQQIFVLGMTTPSLPDCVVWLPISYSSGLQSLDRKPTIVAIGE
ncbi:hypothetical protein G3797_003677 [Salmonella enterica subsp. enterica serovar Virchow]|nr:hypothetical protein [Salmonella enterica subsp. enterica]EEJ6908681.1 hypothetical protein [Salmonella enterica subsp. enterica serovar Stanleyville]EEK8568128.1 hypothetical protein [Salmonella enterica subsp. enterica serovar Virchow]